ncbi:MAG: hypothetical protein PHN75_09020 [Syntrophales bacterium]|nr:hypothetical protein [Syntrophales bacterium]
MMLYEKILLPNGLTLEVWDYSRTIAADTTKVELVAQIEVKFKPDYFAKREYYDKLTKAQGPGSLFEYRKVRTFVASEKKDEVFRELLDAFKKDALPYLYNDDFPRKFAMSKYRDFELHWYKYATPDQEN